MFGRNRVKFIQMGLLQGIQCPCGETGLYQVNVEVDEVITGWSFEDLAKCAYCGRIFVGDRANRDAGKVLGTGKPTSRR